MDRNRLPVYKNWSLSNIKSRTIRNIDLPCLKNYNYEHKLRNGVTLLSSNVGETATPKIVLTESSKAIAVWSDISLVDNDSFQSDIYWSIYDGSSWSQVECTNTSYRCEFNPEIVVVNCSGKGYIVLTYPVVDRIINESTDLDTFYAGTRIHTAV